MLKYLLWCDSFTSNHDFDKSSFHTLVKKPKPNTNTYLEKTILKTQRHGLFYYLYYTLSNSIIYTSLFMWESKKNIIAVERE